MLLVEEMKVLDSFLTGSYRRNTMVAPLSSADIDIFVVLDPSYYEQFGQASLLDKVKRVLQETYPKTPKISRNGQAVTISFTDFQVDVVPGFFRRGGGYLTPDSILKRWIATDPKKHVEIWDQANRNHSYNLRPLIKMIKCWNRENGKLFRSFHLEVLVLTVLKDVKISDFPSGARFVFDKGFITSPTLTLAQESRDLQDEIYDARRTNPRIFNWIYALLREEHEEDMKAGAERLVRQYLTQNPVP